MNTVKAKLIDWLAWQGREIALMPEKTMSEISRKNSAKQAVKEIADIVDTM